MTPTLWLLLGAAIYGAIDLMLYGPRKGDLKPGREPTRDGEESDEDRYTPEGLRRRRSGRWMRWLAFPYLIILARLLRLL